MVKLQTQKLSHMTGKQKQFPQILIKKVAYEIQNLYSLLAFSLITIVFLIVVSIDYYLIKYQAKQNYLLPFHNTNNKLKKFCVSNIL